MSYATYIPFACCLLPQHTLPLDGARRYVDPMIRTRRSGAQADTSVRQFGAHRTWTEVQLHNSSLEYAPQFGMRQCGGIVSDSVRCSKWVFP